MKYICTITLILFYYFSIFSQNKVELNSIGFEENKGQITGENSGQTKFVLKNNDISLFLTNNSIIYQFKKITYPASNSSSKVIEHERLKEEIYRMDIELVNANPYPKIITSKKNSYTVNYYTSLTPVKVSSYNHIVFKDIYPNIDWEILYKENKVKYNFIVHPKGNPADIKIKTKWAERVSLDEEGNLILANRLGEIKELAPVSFQNEGEEISTSFVLNNEEISFKLNERYNRKEKIIIDPTIEWATYYGGSLEDFGYGTTTDANNNVYLVGRTFSNNNISAGGYQVNNGGGNSDAFVVKFSPNGNRIWATYYGGIGWDQATKCAIDVSTNSLYVAGNTSSSSSISFGGHQNTIGGRNDAMLLKFDVNGNRIWATYYGGSAIDYGYDCAVNASGEVILSGITSSTNNISATGFQNIYGGGANDAFIVKFSSTGARQWGTYYGGNGDEIGSSCTFGSNGNVYLAGETSSNTNIANGGFQNVFGGAVDGFILALDNAGARQWATYYGGSGVDQIYSITSEANELYFSGTTNSTTGIASGGFSNTFNGGNSDGFLTRFDLAGARVWSTYYGGASLDRGTSCSVKNGLVYLCGTTNSAGISFNGYQNTFGGGVSDAFVVYFNNTGGRQWATYYGGSNEEEGNTICADNLGNFYFGGTSSSTSSISLNGHQNPYGGGTYDAFFVKFCNIQLTAINLGGITDTNCAPVSANLQGIPAGGDWSVVSGVGSLSGSVYSAPSVAIYSVVTLRYTICGNSIDTSFTLAPLPTAPTSAMASPAVLCQGSISSLSAVGCAGTLVWYDNSSASGAPTLQLVSPNVTTTYYAFCLNSDNCLSSTGASTIVTVQDLIPPTAVCKDTTIYLNNNGTATIDSSYINNGSTDNCQIETIKLNRETFICANLGLNIVQMIVTDRVGNKDTCSANVTVIDNLPPVLNCNDTVLYLSPSNIVFINPSFVNGWIIENCTLDTIYIDKDTFDCNDIGNNTVKLYAVDVSGNIDSCSATVIILENILPMPVCMDTIIYLDSFGVVIIDTSFINNGSTDNCEIRSISLNKYIFTCPNIGVNQVTMYVEDKSGNIDSCIAQVTVLDTINPLPQCLDTVSLSLDQNGQIQIDSTTVTNGCISPLVETIKIDRDQFDCADIGYYSVQVILTDTLGNADTCSTLIDIQDNTPPEINCKDTTVFLTAGSIFVIDPSFVVGSVNDNCQLDSIYIDKDTFYCNNIGSNIVTLYAVDSSGNIDSCTANVTITENIPPTSLCKNITIYLDSSGRDTIKPFQLDNGSFDNCLGVTVFIKDSIFDCGDLGANSVWLYVQDFIGNIDSCTSTVSVLDTITPTVICGTTTLQLDNNGDALLNPSSLDGGSYDNCPNFNFSASKVNFNCSDIGTQNITLTVTDSDGNSNSCLTTVTIEDQVNPSITCNTSSLDTVKSSTCTYLVKDYTNLINMNTDNCSSLGFSYSQSPSVGSVIDAISNPNQTVVITISDSEGNSSQCSINVTLACIKDIEISQKLTPNGDGLNDFIIIKDIDLFPNNSFKIFNRYGSLVYEKKKYDNSFNGKPNQPAFLSINNNYLPSGTYFYVLDLGEDGFDGFTGYIQIMR
jgi:gliding motility-associated-like protein